MNTILKQFAEWGIALKQGKFAHAAFRLAFAYTVGVFLVLVCSSVAIYVFSTTIIPLPPEVVVDGVEYEVPHKEFSLYEFREHLVNVLVLVDAVVLVFAAGVSYMFALHTLRPIELLYRKQEQFVGDVAHELRTPLAVLKAGAESILNKPRSADQYIQFLRELNEETDRLTRLSNDLLLLLKNQQPYPIQSIVNLSDVIRDQIGRLTVYATDKSVTIHNEILPSVVVRGNADTLVRVAQNLIKNAIDYNIQNGIVTISLTDTSDGVVLRVQDTGVGIPPEHRGRIFDRFYKVDRARTSVGTGLGLAIVKEIVEAHQGTISVESVVGKGSIFTVRLPRV